MDFIDIRGASGTAYRFRRWPETGAHPPIAGNFAVVSNSGAILCLGVLDDLSRAPAVLEARLKGAQLFTRFNVSRLHRETEHADLALEHADAAMADAAGQAA
jgi:hypothetical protein